MMHGHSNILIKITFVNFCLCKCIFHRMWLKYLLIMNYVNDESLNNTPSGQANLESGETLDVDIM